MWKYRFGSVLVALITFIIIHNILLENEENIGYLEAKLQIEIRLLLKSGGE